MTEITPRTMEEAEIIHARVLKEVERLRGLGTVEPIQETISRVTRDFKVEQRGEPTGLESIAESASDGLE